MLKLLRSLGRSGEVPRYAPASRAKFSRREDRCRTLARSKNKGAVKKSGVTLPSPFPSLQTRYAYPSYLFSYIAPKKS